MKGLKQFKKWLKSDNVVNTAKDEYRTQCTQYMKGFTYIELRKYFIKEYVNN